jgi:hypothetical protein
MSQNFRYEVLNDLKSDLQISYRPSPVGGGPPPSNPSQRPITAGDTYKSRANRTIVLLLPLRSRFVLELSNPALFTVVYGSVTINRVTYLRVSITLKGVPVDEPDLEVRVAPPQPDEDDGVPVFG